VTPLKEITPKREERQVQEGALLEKLPVREQLVFLPERIVVPATDIIDLLREDVVLPRE